MPLILGKSDINVFIKTHCLTLHKIWTKDNELILLNQPKTMRITISKPIKVIQEANKNTDQYLENIPTTT